MPRSVHALLLLAALAVPLAACGEDDHDHDHGPGGHAHDHGPLPHGGELLELGSKGEAHLEVIHDHKGGNIAVYVYGKDFKDVLHVARPHVLIQTKTGPAEVTLAPVDAKPDGTAHAWKAQHDGLIVDPWDGRIRVTIGGKEYQSPLEGETHDHK